MEPRRPGSQRQPRRAGPMLHEDLQRSHAIARSSDRSFGLVFAGVFLALGLLPMLHGGRTRPWALAVAGLFVLIAVIRPALLAALNRLWSRAGLLLGAAVSPVALVAVYYLTVTPMGLLMRALGKDPLCRRWQGQAQTYWVARRPPGPAPRTMRNQF